MLPYVDGATVQPIPLQGRKEGNLQCKGRKEIYSSVAATKAEWMEERLVCLHVISMPSYLGMQ